MLMAAMLIVVLFSLFLLELLTTYWSSGKQTAIVLWILGKLKGPWRRTGGDG